MASKESGYLKNMERRTGSLTTCRDMDRKMLSKEIVVECIRKDRLPFYLDAGLATDFEVKVIAGEGEEFPFLYNEFMGGPMRTKDGRFHNNEKRPAQLRVSYDKVSEDYVAVSIRNIKPEGTKDYVPFWDNLIKRLPQGSDLAPFQNL